MAKKAPNKTAQKAKTRKKPSRKKALKGKNPNSLTIKQEKFCHAYMETGNASEAYRRAYACGNMKPNTIRVKASELLKNGNITVTLSKLRDELRETADITKERLLYQLECLLESTVFDFIKFNLDNEESYYDEDLDRQVVKIKPRLTLVDPNTLTPQQKRAVKSMKVDKEGNIEVTLHDMNWVSDRIAKLLGHEAPRKVDHTSDGERLKGPETIFIIPANGTEAKED